MLLVSCGFTCAVSYRVEIKGDAGGIVSASGRSMNGSFEISGFSVGEGRYYRITDIKINDVRMKERISAGEGSLDAEERIFVASETTEDPESELIKIPGTQILSVSIEEVWPVVLNAERRLDYMGAGISDREAFGNDLDYVTGSYLYNTDYRRDRTCDLRLNRTSFRGKVADDPLEVAFLPANRALSNKSLNYATDSISNGLATLGYRQVADDLSILREGVDTYAGSFRVSRTISMGSPGIEDEDEEVDWLFCCPKGHLIFELSADETRVFGGI
jgi:hypothetical protein